MADEVPLPLVDKLPERLTGPICCPFQSTEADIPTIDFDIGNDGKCHLRFMDVQERRIERVTRTAPFLFYGKPLTAGRNRCNPPPSNEMEKKQSEEALGGVSYHKVCLYNSVDPLYKHKKVNLMMDDNSQYCVGFQSCTVVEGVEVWSQWYKVRGEYGWPSFVLFQPLNIEGDHGVSVQIGGHETLDDILGGLWRHPHQPLDDTTLQRVFLRGVVVLCETLRLLSVSNEVTDRIERNTGATPLGAMKYVRMRSWTSTCKFLLFTAGTCHGKIQRKQLVKHMRDAGYDSFEELLDEIRIFKWVDPLFKHFKGERKRWMKRKEPGVEVTDPGFGPSLLA
ncbi:hypothetical protein ACQ4PT_052517 [Festuca glaucescens]